MKRLFFILLLLSPRLAWAVAATGPSQPEVQAAVNATAVNGTVTVPAGSSNWTAPVVLTRGITVQGNGIGSTIITRTGTLSAEYTGGPVVIGNLFVISPDATAMANEEIIKITGFTISGNNTASQVIKVNGAGATAAKAYKGLFIIGNRFQNMVGTGFVIKCSGQVRGVIHGNTFDRCNATISVMGPDLDATWQNPAYRNFAYGTIDNLFFENNDIAWSSAYSGDNEGWSETGQGGRICQRYNRYNFTNVDNYELWDIHGFQGAPVSNHQVGTMISEYYGNTITNSNQGDLANHRGSWALFHNNVMVGGNGQGLGIAVSQYNEGCDSISLIPGGQVNNSYAWNNVLGATEFGFFTNPVGTSCGGTIVLNVAIWNFNPAFNGSSGIGRGTAAPSGSNTAGVAYWQNANPLPSTNPTIVQAGTMWKGNGGTSWTPYYTPFTYPHPFVSGVVSPGVLSFSASSYSVNEGGGTVTVSVTRTGGSAGAVGVSYGTSNGTATSGSDYTTTSGTASFPDGDAATKTFTVPILQDAVVDAGESFNVGLSSPTGGATLGTSAASVAIIDDDVTLPPLMPGLSFEAEAGLVEAPFTESPAGSISQALAVTDPAQGGRARWRVTIPSTGNYRVIANINAPSGGSNSLFLDFDAEPTTPTAIWDVAPLTNGLEDRVASWRGTGTTAPEFDPKVWNLTAGVHTLYVRGREEAVAINSITIAVVGAADTTAPLPNPATWQLVPAAASASSVSMTATLGNDLNPIEYLFDEVSGNAGGTDSAWQASNVYTDSGLSPGVQYQYTVAMRDSLGNTGTVSETKSVTLVATTPNPVNTINATNLIIGQTAPADIDLTGFTLTFNDEFDTLSVTETNPKGAAKWYWYPPYGASGGYSDSFWTTSGTMSVSGGILTNTAYWHTGLSHWVSGCLSSMDGTGVGFAQKYGYFSARVRMPNAGQGTWPQFWVFGTDAIADNNTGQRLELDIFEWYGVTHSNAQDVLQSQHQWNGDGSQGAGSGGTWGHVPGGDPVNTWHIYGLLIKTDFITWYIDGVQTFQTVTPTAYHTNPMFILIDYALGGGWALTGQPFASLGPSSMLVDWVRVYSLPL